MNKLFLLMASACMVVSCTQEASLDEFVVPPSNHLSQTTIRSVNDAIDIALKARSDFGLVKSRQSNNVSSIIAIPSVESRAASSDTSLYVVNFEGDGFAIVSSNPKSVGLLAITEDGSINSLDEIDNPGLKQFVHAASKYIPEDFITGYEWYTIETTDTIDFAQVLPRITTRWGQRWPEGYYCPNGIAGCVPLALAQVLGYFETPQSISYTYPSHEYTHENLNWPNIKYTIRSINYPIENFKPSYYNNEYMTLARVCRELGHRMNVDYNNIKGSSTVTSLIKKSTSYSYNRANIFLH